MYLYFFKYKQHWKTLVQYLNLPFLGRLRSVSSHKITSDDTEREKQWNSNKDAVQKKHHHTHDLGHLPLEGHDGAEYDDKHEKEHANVAAHAGGLNGLEWFVDHCVQQPGHR